MKIREVAGRFYLLYADGSSYTVPSKIAPGIKSVVSFGTKEAAEAKIKEIEDSQKSS